MNFCPIAETVQNPFLPFWIFFWGLIILTGFIIRYFFKWHKKVLPRIGGVIVSLIFFIIIFFVGVIFLMITGVIPLGDGNGFPNLRLNQMNAAIKNTCLVDPLKQNCPQNLEQVLILYPEDFEKIQKEFALTYTYYPETNNYTLIGRAKDPYTFSIKYAGNVAVFDQRLVGSEISKGFDFIDTRAYSCGGEFRLKNPLPFPGPWDNIN